MKQIIFVKKWKNRIGMILVVHLQQYVLNPFCGFQYKIFVDVWLNIILFNEFFLEYFFSNMN
jgi:hypothetical protein